MNIFKTLLIFVAVSLSHNLVAQGIPDLIYYKFNDTGKIIRNLATNPPTNTDSATIYGSIKQGSNGTCGGTAIVGSGNLGTTDYVDTHWQNGVYGSWTISFWLRNCDTTRSYFIFSDNNGFYCMEGSGYGYGNIGLQLGSTSFVLPGAAGKHPRVCTIVWDQSAQTLYGYVNGKLVKSLYKTPYNLVTSGTFWLFGEAGAPINGLNANGLMDEFRVYSRALSSKEVSKLLYYGTTYSTTILCGISSFNSPSGKYTWTKSGTYYDTILNNGYCDSLMTFVLTGSNHSSATINVKACDFYVSPSKKFIWTKSGTYTDVIRNKGGCDSNITINLTVNYRTYTSFKITNCNSYKSPTGKYTWTKTGKYLDTMVNTRGCDSVIYINLTINTTSFDTIYVKGCDKYVSPTTKFVWTSPGIYYDTLPNNAGCDSIITIYLTMGKSSKKSMLIKVCDKYKSPSGITGWNKSGIYEDTIINKAGCDSLISIDLTLNKSSFIQIYPNSCGKYTSPSGKYSTTVSKMFYDTLANAIGCDSVMLIDVKINTGTQATLSPIVCKHYVSPSKKHIWKISGKYSDTITNRKGCDSIITINLTVNTVNVGVSQNNARLAALLNGATYQWLDCNKNNAKIQGATNQQYTATALGKYSVEVNDGKCTDTSICYAVTDLSSVKESLSNYLSVFPNPASGQFTISSGKPLNQATITITNTMGEIVIHKNNLNGNNFSLDISDKANGVYFIEIMEKENCGRIKVIKY